MQVTTIFLAIIVPIILILGVMIHVFWQLRGVMDKANRGKHDEFLKLFYIVIANLFGLAIGTMIGGMLIFVFELWPIPYSISICLVISEFTISRVIKAKFSDEY